jgi:diaminopimelate epimerase
VSYPFLKGHGTENDFLLLPDHDGTVHGDLSRDRVRALCDRRAGIGGDGVLRVIRTSALDSEIEWGSASAGESVETSLETEWFMDYRNSDGSLSEMCGNGIRLFARHLVDEGLVEPRGGIPIATRDGVKLLTVEGDSITADLGSPKILGETMIGIGDRCWPARHVDMGNPHAVVFIDDLSEAGPLLEPPVHDAAFFPHGVNVEFVVRRAARHIAMRVHERGSGETRSCGTGACAAMVGAALADGGSPSDDLAYRVDVPGGTLTVTWTADDRILLGGPAVVVARGTSSL